MEEIIIVRGASCTGKSTLIESIRQNFKLGVCIEVDTIRYMINSVDWYDELHYLNSIDISLSLVKKFADLKYFPIFLSDTFSYVKLQYALSKLDFKVRIVSLYCEKSVLISRLSVRKDYKRPNFESPIRQNQDTIQQSVLKTEDLFIDTSTCESDEVYNSVMLALFGGYT